jgi:hypothetical protein
MDYRNIKVILYKIIDNVTAAALIKEDRRLVRLKLTAKGRRTFELIEERALEWEREFVKGLSIKELNQLNQTLSRLDENLDSLAGAG